MDLKKLRIVALSLYQLCSTPYKIGFGIIIFFSMTGAFAATGTVTWFSIDNKYFLIVFSMGAFLTTLLTMIVSPWLLLLKMPDSRLIKFMSIGFVLVDIALLSTILFLSAFYGDKIYVPVLSFLSIIINSDILIHYFNKKEQIEEPPEAPDSLKV